MANIIRIGGGGGGSSTLITKSITDNGTYLAIDDNADGYSEVSVNVSGGAPIITDLISTPATSASTEPFANSEYSSAMAIWKAFDKTDNTSWASADSSGDKYIGWKFDNAVVVNRVSMKSQNDATWALKQSPALWEVQGSNDDGVTWETVNTYSHYWTSALEEFTYDFDNASAYKWWRILIKRTMDGTTGCAVISELDFYNVSYGGGGGIDYIESWIITNNTTTMSTHIEYTNNGQISSYAVYSQAGNTTQTEGDMAIRIGSDTNWKWLVTALDDMTYKIYDVANGTLSELRTATNGTVILSNIEISGNITYEIRRYS